jgi:hypothetical protein
MCFEKCLVKKGFLKMNKKGGYHLYFDTKKREHHMCSVCLGEFNVNLHLKNI